jgi:hypothetical protein
MLTDINRARIFHDGWKIQVNFKSQFFESIRTMKALSFASSWSGKRVLQIPELELGRARFPRRKSRTPTTVLVTS